MVKKKKKHKLIIQKLEMIAEFIKNFEIGSK